METSIPESQIPSETADCYDFPFSTSAVWASKTVKLLRLQGPTVDAKATEMSFSIARKKPKCLCAHTVVTKVEFLKT